MWELGELARGVLKATGLLVVVTIVILLVSYIVSALFETLLLTPLPSEGRWQLYRSTDSMSACRSA
jgi:hypothetical protein